MPRKRALPSPADDGSLSDVKIDAPVRPKVELRRSGRNLPQNQRSIREEDRTREIQGKVLGLPDHDGDPHNMADRKENMKEGLQMAIEGLARMERRLRKATKRQKIKIEESNVDGATIGPAPNEPIHPESFKDTVLKRTQQDGRSVPAQDKDVNDVTAGVEQDGPYTEVGYANDVDEEPAERGAARTPPVNSNYLPLPWKGRLGYACLNTYLRTAKPPVFSSRTCRMSSIIDHRYPLQDQTQPEHALKNRPDKTGEPRKELGDKFVQALGLANARDIVKMLRWNDKYGIKFMRLSSEMFPFASHNLHGYKLALFASEVLAEAGKVAAELGHRLTTHPGQFTQLGSPRKEVVKAAIRDLEYHNELLSLLCLPEQQDRDAVMILHMGGTFGDKAATLDRFRQNYATLSPEVKRRLVLENDDVSWSVHDLLPICEELDIPLVLDFHHHNIIFDSSQCREGTHDISQPAMLARIAATWKRKAITQKMHYSEPCFGAVTPKDRRKHSPRVMTLPPCPPDMDLMIEAKDKEQAVFELMRTFRLPGFERINDVIPHERDDESKPAPPPPKKKKNPPKRKRGAAHRDTGDQENGGEEHDVPPPQGKEVSDEDFAMGGPENRVYWPLGKEEWLKPKKREVKKGVMNEDDDEEF
ncbi:UV-endonuclease UvdE-domain-containing protein [Lasiosphaeria miniovina]|uniref:UV-endonuclease UvdE-domain-containing protein n=1 Tax=Lasiosphaeria miniovina TaxID=1954250 RepID=A0AA40B6V2_9PEZI|nr:UV-endonuclease UvdE-domain-containing protein [Lasiosphaeria miniovina]KAK0728788.1 UV-endonuclease UvdE-domain-containing protein [Lasiosphaeria miniovina]